MHVITKRNVYTFILLCASLLIANGLEESYSPNGQWIGDGSKSVTVENTTNKEWVYDGLRFTSENIQGITVNVTHPAKDWKSVDDGNGPDRYQFRIPPGGNAANRLKPGASITASVSFYQWGFKEDWTPTERQFMVKTGTFAKDKGYKDIKGVTVHYLDSISKLHWFYDPNTYYPDSLGIHGGKFSGGFIDTWYDQVGDTAIWQVQIALPEKATKNQWLWNEWNRYNPGIMGAETKSGAYAGKGPNYAMALIMAQDYMNVDMQLLAGIGTKESNAGIESGAENTGTPTGGSKYKTFNTDGELGTNHYIATSYRSYILDPYPKFFPNYSGFDDASRYYINTPGYGSGASGNTVGNSPQLGNNAIINSLYMWYGFELLFNATEWWASKIFETAKDRELAAKLYAWGWNKGFNSGWMNPMLDAATVNKTPAEIDLMTPDYCWGVFHSINEMKKANRNSTTNGGTSEIYDEGITRNQVEEFFFGTGGDGDAGTLGTGGILWHFDHNDEKRKDIWKDVNDAFDILKGRAPTSGLGSDEISLRYDWLGILRVAKLHLDLERPIPSVMEFINWVDQYSDTNVIPIDSIVIENNYPFVVKGAQNTNGTTGDVTLKITAKDDYMLRNDSLGDAVSWTLDSNWGNWTNITRDGGDKDSASFTITVPRSAIVAQFGDGVSGGTGQGIAWFRVDDRNFNTIVDSFFVSVDVTPTPTLDSSIAVDTKGDGMADRIDIFLTKPDGFDLSSHSNLTYSWPDKLNPVSPATTTVNGDKLEVVDAAMSGGAGEGQVGFDYPGKNNYKTSVHDRVGPAMVTATLTITDAGRARDTLVITTTEPLKDAHSTNIEYLFLNENNQVSSESVIKVSNTEWRFIFPKNEVVDKDSTKFVFTGTTVSDTVGNTPLDINQWVKINVVGGKEPVVKKSWIMDTNGDGLGDSIRVTLTLGEAVDKYTITDIASGLFSWPTNSLNETLNTGGLLETNDSAFSFTYSSSAGAGLGRIELSFPDDYDCSGNIEDSVGPAMTTASFSMADPNRDYDTLHITTSEPLLPPTGTDTEYLFLNENNKESSKSILKISETEWLVLFTKGTVVDKDSTKFTFTNTTVEDTVGNKPLDSNQWVQINKSGGKDPIFKSAYIMDIDGDGDGDSIRVELSTGEALNHYTVSDLDSGRYSWPTDALDLVLSTSTLLAVTDSGFSYIYNSNNGEGTGKTALSFPDDITIEGAIEDSVGPVITTATLSIHDANRDKDTLVLITSEALSKIDKTDHNYLFLNESLKEESENVEDKGSNEYWFIFPKGLVAGRDSVKFVYDTDPVEDAKGNKPMDINQWIPLNIVGGREPAMDTAFIVDTDGNGDGDSIYVELSLGAAKDRFTVDSLVGGNFSWPDILLGNALVPANFLEKSDSTFSFLYDSDQGEGTGKIAISFPQYWTLNGEIQDGVGPVIDSAICLQVDENRDRDTLILETSEALTDNFADNTKYLILFEDSSDTDGDTITVENTSKDGDNYRFIVSKDAVTYGDWVQFVYNSGIKDLADNSPIDINQKVLINVKGPISPRITTAAIFDVKGNNGRVNGDGDSIYVSLKLSEDPKALTVDSLKEVSYSWGGATKTVVKSDLMYIDSATFAIVDETLFGGSGSGSLTLTFDNDKYEVQGTIVDSVAPVIVSATYYNWNSIKDTLIVTFSEELGKTGSKTPFNVTGADITVLKQDDNGSEVTYSIESSAEMAFGDSIWIKANEEIVDEESNEQDTDMNVKVPLSYFRVTSLTEAAYFETDSRPDGYIDEVILTFDSDIPKAVVTSIKDNITLPKEREFTKGDLTLIDDNRISLALSQNSSNVEANTATEKYDTLSIAKTATGDTLIFASSGGVSIRDSLAPVIVSARFSPADEGEEDEKLIDTLILSYSEAVEEISVDDPFRFSDGSDGDNEYTLPFSGDNSGKKDVIYLNEYKQVNVLPGVGDSIWIYEDGEIEDNLGLVQTRNTKPVPITVENYARDYKVSISPTPFNNANYEDSVVTIRIQPRTRVLPDDIQAEFVILDKVGNEIMQVSKDEFGDIENDMLSYSFQPRNRFDRKLGAGSYSVQLVITAAGASKLEPLQMAIQDGEAEDE